MVSRNGRFHYPLTRKSLLDKARCFTWWNHKTLTPDEQPCNRRNSDKVVDEVDCFIDTRLLRRLRHSPQKFY